MNELTTDFWHVIDSCSLVQLLNCRAPVECLYGYCEHAATQRVNQIARRDRQTVLSTSTSVARHIRLLRCARWAADVESCWKSSMFVFHYIKRWPSTETINRQLFQSPLFPAESTAGLNNRRSKVHFPNCHAQLAISHSFNSLPLYLLNHESSVRVT